MNHFENIEKDESLRPYQSEVKQKIYEAWKTQRSIMLQMPTGTGKTRVFCSIVIDIHKESIKTKKAIKVLVLVHRRELIEQASETLGLKYNIAHGIILSRYFEQKKMPTQIASVQTLKKRLSNWSNKKFDYIIIDEAHHALAPTYKSIIDEFSTAKILGVSATPYRLSGESFTSIFQKLIQSYTVLEFIEKGFLSNYKYYSIPPQSNLNIRIQNITDLDINGDYSEKAMFNILNSVKIRADIMRAYENYAKGKKGIVYTINKRHNFQIAELYKSHGISVKAIDSDTSAEERGIIIEDFKRGNIQVLCNVNIFSEGFDCPDIEFIQLARPTKSLSLFLQQVGRGLRTHKDIDKVIFLDNIGSHNQFGLPSNPHNWNAYFSGQKNILINSTSPLPIESNIYELIDEIENGTEDVELLHETEATNLIGFDECSAYPIIKIDRSLFMELLLDNKYDFKSIREEILNTLDLFDEWEHEETKLPIEKIEEFYEDVKCYNTFFKVRKGNLYGIMSNLNEVIIPIEYEEIKLANGFGYSICKKNGKVGIIDILNQTVVVPTEFDDLQTLYYTGNYKNYIVKNEFKEGIYNVEQGLKLKIIYDEIICEKQHYNVHINSVWKVFDKNFNQIKEFDSFEIVEANDNYGIVGYKGSVGLWNTISGGLVFPISCNSFLFKYNFIISSLKSFSSSESEYFFLLDEFLNIIIIPFKYTKMSFYDKNKLLVYGNTKDSLGNSHLGYGILDTNGNIIITTKYESITNYKDKLLVKSNTDWMIIDWDETIIKSSNKQIDVKKLYDELTPKTP